MLDELFAMAQYLNHRFPKGNDPFQIMTRLLEECRELAQQVNHFQDSGIKHEKHGAPDKVKLAKEVMDVIRGALSIALYYGIEKELEQTFQKAYQAMLRESQ